MSRCGQTNCAACPFVKEGNSVKVGSNEKWQIRKKVNCLTYHCIYMLECKKCGKRYIGETGRLVKARLSDHRGYISNQVIGVATGDHFNLPGHSLADLSITVLERVKKNDESYRKEREKYLINKLNTHYKGINREST